MRRRIIAIDREKCNGCGLCARACHEGAIDIVDGKAQLTREHYCDGLGDCLPACPENAISFEEREAPAYDEAAVLRSKREKEAARGPLQNWPVQLKLSPVTAPCFAGAELLIAADCTAFACGDFSSRYSRGRTVLIGCPKLDGVDYAEKLAQIFNHNEIKSITVTRMEVPCCGGLVQAVKRALDASGKEIPCRVAIIGVDGRIIREA